MAELILTEKEKADPTYLDWTDDALGKLVRKTALMLKDEYGVSAGWTMAAAKLLVGVVNDCNGDELTLTLEGFAEGDQERGDWQIVIKKVGD